MITNSPKQNKIGGSQHSGIIQPCKNESLTRSALDTKVFCRKCGVNAKAYHFMGYFSDEDDNGEKKFTCGLCMKKENWS